MYSMIRSTFDIQDLDWIPKFLSIDGPTIGNFNVKIGSFWWSVRF